MTAMIPRLALEVLGRFIGLGFALQFMVKHSTQEEAMTYLDERVAAMVRA